MRDRRVMQKSPEAVTERGAELFWAAVIAAICVRWLAAMGVTSCVGYELKSPVGSITGVPNRPGIKCADGQCSR